jgi:hypothetical protein
MPGISDLLGAVAHHQPLDPPVPIGRRAPVPAKAGEQYPYATTPPLFPGDGFQGSNYTFTPTPLYRYRGFIYVMGDMINKSRWSMSGVLRVDGKLMTRAQYSDAPILQLYYDDEINQNIVVSPFRIQVASMAAL